MPFYIDKQGLAASRGLQAQADFIANARASNYRYEGDLAQRHGLAVNAGQIPAEVWRDFDNQTKQLMTSDEAGVLMNDLSPLSRNVNIGKIVSEYRQYSADMGVRSSIDGQHAKPVGHGTYDFDGALVLVHSTQVGRNWRELEGMRSEGFDALLDDQAAGVRFVRRRMGDDFVNGTKDVKYKGYGSAGIKAHANTQALDLGASGVNVNLTTTTKLAEAKKAFVSALKTLQGSDNNAVGNVTFYVSDDIWFNLMNMPTDTTVAATDDILTLVRRTPGIADIKRTDACSGNEFIGIILSAEYIRPIVGMPVTSTPIQRVTPMDDFHILVWAASGLQIRADAKGRAGVLYASAA